MTEQIGKTCMAAIAGCGKDDRLLLVHETADLAMLQNDIKTTALAKLESVSVSAKLASLMWTLLGAEMPITKGSEPFAALSEVYISGDSLLGAEVGDIGANLFIGAAHDLYRNLCELGQFVSLTTLELGWVLDTVKQREL